MTQYPVLIVPDDAHNTFEQLGTKFKFWYVSEDEKRCLFKQGRVGTGEDWAEKVSCEIAEFLGIPHANYDFATWKDINGIVSHTIVPLGSRLVLGNEVIGKPSGRREAKEHLYRLVMAVMKHPSVKPPSLGTHPELSSAADYFTGYLMLDALIGNQDRHAENWGLIRTPDTIELAPSYDHASSLGRNESDENREKRLNTKDRGYSVEAYTNKCRSALYSSSEDKKAIPTMEAFWMTATAFPSAAKFWLDRLEALEEKIVVDILSKVPDTLASEPAKRFALEMIKVNRKKLLQLKRVA